MKWLIIALLVTPTSSQDPISFTVTPLKVLYRKPTYARAVTRIPPHSDNRWRSLSWSSETGISGTEIRQLEGAESAMMFERIIEVEPGAYVIRACLFRTRAAKPDGRPYCVARNLEVIGE